MQSKTIRTMVKEKVKTCIRLLASPMLRMLYSCRLLKPSVVIRMDGGICSQMHFYLIGCLFQNKNCKIEFDLNWFKVSGKDSKGEFCRNFDLLKLFPALPFNQASRFKSRLYRLLFLHLNDYYSTDEMGYLKLNPPLYLAGYYKDPDELYKKLFGQHFVINANVLDADNRTLWEHIRKTANATAIHIRRGDLSDYHPAYGTPCTPSYFANAISYLGKKYQPECYFIFSDEPEWCRKELIPQLPAIHHYQIADLNGSDKGYMDLVLMSCCQHTITSQGSLGKFAALLKQQKGETIVYDNEFNRGWSDILPCSVLIGN